VESSLCSLGTASVFVAALFTTTAARPKNAFDVVVYGSAGAVLLATVIYSTWCVEIAVHV
jgi:NADH:ubiquinone oxidoreductase subunit 6 (subunit J)